MLGYCSKLLTACYRVGGCSDAAIRDEGFANTCSENYCKKAKASLEKYGEASDREKKLL